MEHSMTDDTEELAPSRRWRDTEESQYWIRDGQVRWKEDGPIRGAHPETFVFYRSGYAKDKKRAYCYGRRLSKSDGPSFRAYNFCYHGDKNFVWALDGYLRDVDIPSFRVLDRGYRFTLRGRRVPSGYAADREHVYYYGFEGRATVVRKADPKSFASEGDCVYGRGNAHVFCRKKILKGAEPASWQMLAGNYSKDASHIFYDDRPIPCADYDTFAVTPVSRDYIQLASDRNHHFHNDRIISREKFDELLAECGNVT